LAAVTSPGAGAAAALGGGGHGAEEGREASGRSREWGRKSRSWSIFFLIFFAEGHWPHALGKDPLCRGPSQALGKFFFLIFFAEGHWPGPRQIFLFCFLNLVFCGAIIYYLKLNFKIWANFDFF